MLDNDSVFGGGLNIEASGEAARLPWAMGEPHPSLVSWLNTEGPCLVRPGCRVAVVGQRPEARVLKQAARHQLDRLDVAFLLDRLSAVRLYDVGIAPFTGARPTGSVATTSTASLAVTVKRMEFAAKKTKAD